MAALLVKMHQTANDYIDSIENQALSTETGCEFHQLSRAVIKKQTFDSERAYMFHFVQPGTEDVMEEFHPVAQNHSKENEMKKSCFLTMNCLSSGLCFWLLPSCSLKPWVWWFSIQEHCAVSEIHITDMEKLKGLFLSLANKFAKGAINENCLRQNWKTWTL